MNKTLLVTVIAALAGVAFVCLAVFYPPLNVLFTAGKSLFLSGLGVVQSAVTTNPLTAPIATLVGSAVTALVMRSSGLTKQKEIVESASKERTDIITQTDAIRMKQNETIESLTAKVEGLGAQVQETASLKTEVATLKTSLSAAEQEAQRVRDEYNALIRIKAVAESLPVPVETVH